eukprot:TRINITY_DN4511_c0_g1_i1.p1 TRINITY_DN4511_c0_g1~~TRINITY_DN4511_c0_g1_i1.p1  ORF type:complete len:209 (-),score=26.22 TRINITY_DN4511_c0_g1_i1:46-672(-)
MKMHPTFCLCLLLCVTFTLSAPLVEVNLYAMSKCPDASSWEDQFYPLFQLGLNNITHLTIDFIATVDNSEPTGFKSLHGESEVIGDFYSLCAFHYYQQNYLWYKYVHCLNKEIRNIPNNAQSCAMSCGLDHGLLNSCVHSDLAKTLMRDSIQRTNQRNITWSPTIFINGEEYCKWHMSDCKAGNNIANFITAICGAYTGSQRPSICPN